MRNLWAIDWPSVSCLQTTFVSNRMSPFAHLGSVAQSDILDSKIFEGPERYWIHTVPSNEAFRFVRILQSDMRDAGRVVPRYPWLRRHRHGYARWSVVLTIRGRGVFRASWADQPAIMVGQHYWILPDTQWDEGQRMVQELIQQRGTAE